MLLERLGRLLRGHGPSVPFSVEEVAEPDAAVEALFQASFRVAAPRFPFHFVARWHGDGSVAGYVHFTRQEPGVYLVGGLCVDPHPYRLMARGERDALRAHGSLSRWLLAQGIARLVSKRAVFAYTGNAMSMRDCLALGFEPTGHRYLIVQWHSAAESERGPLIARVEALGPF